MRLHISQKPPKMYDASQILRFWLKFYFILTKKGFKARGFFQNKARDFLQLTQKPPKIGIIPETVRESCTVIIDIWED